MSIFTVQLLLDIMRPLSTTACLQFKRPAQVPVTGHLGLRFLLVHGQAARDLPESLQRIKPLSMLFRLVAVQLADAKDHAQGVATQTPPLHRGMRLGYC